MFILLIAKQKPMELTTLLILIAIGLTAGVLGGMVGLGGGIVIIPGLIMLLGLTTKEAQGTSVAVMLPPIGILAAINYYKSGYVNIKFALVIALAFILGGWFGSKLAIGLPEATIKKVFAAFMVLVAVKIFLGK
jgi:uncharacterized membrane protein YfcA